MRTWGLRKVVREQDGKYICCPWCTEMQLESLVFWEKANEQGDEGRNSSLLSPVGFWGKWHGFRKEAGMWTSAWEPCAGWSHECLWPGPGRAANEAGNVALLRTFISYGCLVLQFPFIDPLSWLCDGTTTWVRGVIFGHSPAFLHIHGS